MINIVTQKYQEGRPKKRLRGRTQCNSLNRLAADHRDAFDQLVAISTWRAEQARATQDLRPINRETAEAGFETDPIKWKTNKIINLHWTRREAGLTHINITPMPFSAFCKEITEKYIDID